MGSAATVAATTPPPPALPPPPGVLADMHYSKARFDWLGGEGEGKRRYT